jgi:protein-S-isoprenylcysteine O-methyltransferase Ste14
MRSLALKIPPPIVALLFGLLMWLVSWRVVAADVSFGYRVAIAIIVASIGIVVGVAAMGSFVRAKTTMNPTKPTAATLLVTHGVFRFTRNPMYLSLVLYLLAWAIYLSNWLALFLVPVFVLYINQFQIEPEERALSTLFGEEYASYKARVRRWL